MEVMVIEEALLARPDDFAAWHAYSERLLGEGDARGTLIRLEQRLARTRPADRPAVEREIADLVAEHEGQWGDGLPGGARVLSSRYGFATEVAVKWSDDLREHVEQVLRAPFVTTLRITSDKDMDWNDEDDDAADDDEADGEDDEDGDDEDGDDEDWDDEPRLRRVGLGPLAGLDLGRLTELDLSYLSIGSGGAELLAGLFVSDRLRALDLRYCRVADTGLAALAARPQLGGLRRLRLQRNEVSAEGVRSLHAFTELTELDLRYNELGTTGAQALLAAPFTGSLTRLWLYDADVGQDGVRELAQAGNLPPGLRSMWRCV
ncbi:hypothetical protein OIE66_06270 [Nonomuraea sp. NBC_01738]|uniref:hypothetical protein n=1 Tax=Nonomuraea sp. NBC_01738 TaxID=2976003 RepID=UPI002E10A05B|nr:hypothetical protein OIE66_06270 [Nonomuraea sp. NBC_01738]